MELAVSILGLLSLIVGWLVWRDQAASAPDQQHAAMLGDLRAAIVDAELNGQLATADSLRERLRQLTDPVRAPDGGGQRLAVPTPGGNQDNSADAGDGGAPASHGRE